MRISRWSDLLIALGLMLLIATVLMPSTWQQDALGQQAAPVRQSGPPTDAAATSSRAPVRVVATEVHLDAAVDPVGVAADGALALPDDAGRAGWWIGGAAAGDARGSTVIAGHVDSRDGVGAMFALHRVRAGMRVQVHTANGGSVAYVVTGSQRYHKRKLPVELFSTAGTHRLVLITCGGPFDPAARSYRDNVVVTAERL